MSIKKIFITLSLCIIIYLFFHSDLHTLPVEELDIPSGIGVDLIIDTKGYKKYNVPVSVYNFSDKNSPSRFINTGIGETIGETRENRQKKSNHKLLLGLEKIYIINEAAAENGIEDFVDAVFSNPHVNDTALLGTCKNKSINILKLNITGYPSSADYIEGLIENSKNYNFYANSYNWMDSYIKLNSEGRNLAIPYIEIKDNKIQITGIALFDKYKMVKKLNINETKIMNMLRENKVKGVLSLQKSPNKYIDYYTKTKRKVYCTKEKNKFNFLINLTLNGDIITNNLYNNVYLNPLTNKQFKKDMEKKVENICYDFIEKMQKDYKIDCLELGAVAAAKYGRKTGVDWNKLISNSNIKVKVNIKIDNRGRGEY